MKEHNLHLQENGQKRLWKRIDIPCSLHDAVEEALDSFLELVDEYFDIED